MLILLDCRPLQNAGSGGEKARLIFSVAVALAADKAVKWLLLVDHTYRSDLFPDLPDLPVVVQRALPGRAGWKLWYDWQIPRLVRKHRPDLVMLTGGVAAASMPVPQYLWMPVHADPQEGGKELPLYAGRLDSSLRRAEKVFCFSERDRSWLAGRGGAGFDKLVVVGPAPSGETVMLSAAERERAKDGFARGREYFFADATGGGEEDVIYLLKAFSLFKKRQLSNLQLVVAGVLTAGLGEKLRTYKYKEDVHWCDPMAANDRLVGAYAALLSFDGDVLGTRLVDAWKAGVPVLVTKPGRLLELAGNATLGAGATDPAAFAGHMMSVYKDEALRAGLIERGLSRLAGLDPAQGVNSVWAVIGRVYPIIN